MRDGCGLTSQDEILCVAQVSQNLLQRRARERAGMVFMHNLLDSKHVWISIHFKSPVQSWYETRLCPNSAARRFFCFPRSLQEALTGSLDRGCNSSMMSASGVEGVKMGAPAGVSATTCTTCPLASRYFWSRLRMAFREESTSATCNSPFTYLHPLR